MCEDFNFGSVLWEENRVDTGGYNAGQSNNFLEAINDCHWVQHVKEWTHMRDTENLSRLDLIFSKYEQDIENVMYKAPVGFSKHAVICYF